MNAQNTVSTLVFDVTSGTYEPLESYGSLEEALADVREFWMEEERGEQTVVIHEDTTGRLLAVLTRPDASDPELCLTTCFEPGGALALMTLHRCRYLTDAKLYDRTEVTRIELEDLARPYG